MKVKIQGKVRQPTETLRRSVMEEMRVMPYLLANMKANKALVRHRYAIGEHCYEVDELEDGTATKPKQIW